MPKKENDKMFKFAVEKLPDNCKDIEEQREFDTPKSGLAHKILAAKPMIKLFDKMIMSAEKFTVNEKCISCGLCPKPCPKNVVSIVDGKPV